MRFAAVVLAGGRGARLGGVDKASLEYDGRTLLEHVLDSLIDAEEIVVVGHAVPTTRPVTFTLEDPAGGGPVAGLFAGTEALLRRPDLVGVTAVDMPWLRAGTWSRLRAAVGDGDGAWLREDSGHRALTGVVRPDALAAADPGLEQRHNLPLYRLLAPLDLADVAARHREDHDVDTWDDVLALREEFTDRDALRAGPRISKVDR